LEHVVAFWVIGLNGTRSVMTRTSPETVISDKLAKLERKRIFAEEASKAMQEVADRAIAVRANMARLRELRMAREVAEPRPGTEAANAPRRRAGPLSGTERE
jgi:hypothetical protein